jgi:hypothetical protein
MKQAHGSYQFSTFSIIYGLENAIGKTYAKYPGHRFESYMAPRSRGVSEFLCNFSTSRIEPNRRDVGFSRLKAKRLGLVDDFRTFRVEKPTQEFFGFCQLKPNLVPSTRKSRNLIPEKSMGYSQVNGLFSV